jgi:hypothetical protein
MREVMEQDEDEMERCGRSGRGVEDWMEQSSNEEGVRTMADMEKARSAQTGDGVLVPPANPGRHADGMSTTRHAGRIAIEHIYAMLLDPTPRHAERRSERDTADDGSKA